MKCNLQISNSFPRIFPRLDLSLRCICSCCEILGCDITSFKRFFEICQLKYFVFAHKTFDAWCAGKGNCFACETFVVSNVQCTAKWTSFRLYGCNYLKIYQENFDVSSEGPFLYICNTSIEHLFLYWSHFATIQQPVRGMWVLEFCMPNNPFDATPTDVILSKTKSFD